MKNSEIEKRKNKAKKTEKLSKKIFRFSLDFSLSLLKQT